MKKLILAALLFSTSAAAETHTPVTLNWQNQTHTDATLKTYKSALVTTDGSVIIFYKRWLDDTIAFAIQDKSGAGCATLTHRDYPVILKCSTGSGYFWLVKRPHKNATLEWVMPDPPPGPRAAL